MSRSRFQLNASRSLELYRYQLLRFVVVLAAAGVIVVVMGIGSNNNGCRSSFYEHRWEDNIKIDLKEIG
jgi:hypothetical protein